MKRITTSIALLLTCGVTSVNSYGQDDTVIPDGPYLGQPLPGNTPEPFAPGIVATDGWEYGLTFMPNMKEAYFIRENPDTEKHEFVLLQNKNAGWHKTVVSPRLGQPVISPDGNIMHLGRRYKERKEGGWSDVEILDERFNELQIMRMSSSSAGTFAFDEVGMPGGVGVIRYSRLIDGERQGPEPFGPEINSGTFNAHPFIAPNESYIIWDGRRESGYGSSDLYISYRQPDGSWSDAINLGDKINTDAWEAAASVTPDGKFLFFNRMIDRETSNVDIFWVDAGIIEELRPK